MTERLSLEEARRILDAAVSECERRGVKTAVAVVDDHGQIVAAARLDGARHYYADVAVGKAMSAAIFKEPSRSAGAWSAPAGTLPAAGSLASMPRPPGGNGVQARVNQLHGNRIVYAPGAVPLYRDGVVIGAVGVGGSGPDGDESVAILAAKQLDAS